MHIAPCSVETRWVNTGSVGAWPSGKASVFGTVYRRFESYRPSHLKNPSLFNDLRWVANCPPKRPARTDIRIL